MRENAVEGNNNTADFSAKIRPIKSKREAWLQPQSYVWLHLKGTVLIHEVSTGKDIIRHFIPVERVKVMQSTALGKIRKDIWISLVAIIVCSIVIISGIYLEWMASKQFSFIPLVIPTITLPLIINRLYMTRHAIAIMLEYGTEGLSNEFIYRAGKNKRLDEFLLKLSEMQKTTSCSSSFQDAATQKAIPLYKQPFSDERLRGILLGGILGCIIISFMSISIATILFIIVFGIILYRFLDRFAEAVKFPKIFRHVISLYAKREYEKAVQILTVFLKQNPSNTDAWSYLIQSQIRLGRYDEAHDSLNKMSSLPYANAYEIEKLNKQIQSWKIIIERMGGADPERIEPYKSALRIQNSY